MCGHLVLFKDCTRVLPQGEVKGTTYLVQSSTVKSWTRGCSTLVFAHTFHNLRVTQRRAQRKLFLLLFTSQHWFHPAWRLYSDIQHSATSLSWTELHNFQQMYFDCFGQLLLKTVHVVWNNSSQSVEVTCSQSESKMAETWRGIQKTEDKIAAMAHQKVHWWPIFLLSFLC